MRLYLLQTLGSKTSSTVKDGPRIAPVNSALIASVRPSGRDPRLAKLQAPGTGSAAAHAHPPSAPVPNTNHNIHTNNSNIVEHNYKVKTSSKTHNTDIAGTNSKLASNKVSAQAGTLNHKDPRLLSKVQGPINSRSKTTEGGKVKSPFSNNLSNKTSVPTSTVTSSSSSSTQSSGNKNPARKSNKSSTRSFNKKSVKQSSKSTDSIKPSTSSSSSPSKYKKKSSEHSPRTDKSDKRSKSKSEKRSRDRSGSDKYENEQDSVHVSPTVVAASLPQPATVPSPPERAFKELKGVTKNRNYIRRNRVISVSPEPSQDVDLRVGAPPEKQPRLHVDPSPATEDGSNKSKTSINVGNFGSVIAFKVQLFLKKYHCRIYNFPL